MSAQVTREDFPTWDAFVATAADPSRRQWRQYDAARTGGAESGEEAWWGADFATAVRLARFGWPEGRAAMMTAMAVVKPQRDLIPERFWDVAGEYPDVVRAIAGDPMSMINHRPGARAARPVARIDYGRSARASVSGEAISNRGAALLGMVDALESAGISVELRLIFKTSKLQGDAARAYHSVVTLKAAGEALDIDRAAFALVNPAVLRRLGFAMREQHAELETAFGAGYGSTDYSPLADQSEADTIWVEGASEEDRDPAVARARMATAFAAYLGEGAP